MRPNSVAIQSLFEPSEARDPRRNKGLANTFYEPGFKYRTPMSVSILPMPFAFRTSHE